MKKIFLFFIAALLILQVAVYNTKTGRNSEDETNKQSTESIEQSATTDVTLNTFDEGIAENEESNPADPFFDKSADFWGCEISEDEWYILEFQDDKFSDYIFESFSYGEGIIKKSEKVSDDTIRMTISYQFAVYEDESSSQKTEIEISFKSTDGFRRQMILLSEDELGNEVGYNFTYLGKTGKDVDNYINKSISNPTLVPNQPSAQLQQPQ